MRPCPKTLPSAHKVTLKPDLLGKADPLVTSYTAVYLGTIHPFCRTVANQHKRGIASFSWIRGIQNHITVCQIALFAKLLYFFIYVPLPPCLIVAQALICI